MGARTRNYSEIDSVRRIYVEGNAACQEFVIPVRPRRSDAKRLAKEALLKQQEKIRRGSVYIAVGLVAALLVFLLISSVRRNDLSTEINALETQVSELREQNDSKEYEINSAVDLDYIVQVATGELGMVRSGIGQIETYNSDDAEYTQQLAEIPTK